MNASSRPVANIILVEDDIDLAAGWTELFELLDFKATSFIRGLPAIADSAAIRAGNILISDYYLPDINGIELIRAARLINPTINCILLTGSRDPGIVESVAKIPDCTLIYKPVNIDTIEDRVNQILGQLANEAW